ncbi:arsenate reductase ArsC [Oceanicoccus sp. KOV_DT_Chl]|uniref:arsenate reductase ArsC n=1 Tax=Oceanicoccus sp. KOV_DT_Chl TaxID=1904639 RepID=UPI000C7B8795|nr:arsenate reductase ArsC [Oceanicoccus sp. KOV_DT_Chl]
MKILFICTHNRCRSILSQAITNHLSNGRVTAYSAGSQPADQVHPLSLKYLQQKGISTSGLHSKSWDIAEELTPDVVITVCDSAASEACPVWFGNTIKVHWGLPDPSKLDTTEEQVEAAFYSVMTTIERRIHSLLAFDFEHADKPALQAKLQEISEIN